MSRLLSLLTLCLAAMLAGCGGGGTGGGANTNPPNAVSMYVQLNQDSLIECEMYKEVTANLVELTVGVNANLTGEIEPSVSTIRIDRYELTYTRRDGQTTLAPISGPIGQTIGLSGTFSSTLSFDAVVFHSQDKIFSEFADYYFANDFPGPVDFDAVLTVFGANNAGQSFRSSVGFTLQAGVYLPVDDFAPVISYFNQTNTHTTGDTYLATWQALGLISSASFVFPWGDTVSLPATTSFFPVGQISGGTGGLGVPAGTTATFDSGVLFVGGPFGVAQSAGDGNVTVSTPAEPEPDPPPVPDPVSINDFFGNRTTIQAGDPVTLTWNITGDVESLEILPRAYNGVDVDFTGLDLNFGSLTINPTESVRPLLRAIGEDGVAQTSFLAESIVIEDPPVIPLTPPTINFFLADRNTVFVGRSATLYWSVGGDIDHVELFPIAGQAVDVTDVNSFVLPPFVEVSSVSYRLFVYGKDSSVTQSTVTISASRNLNNPITLSTITQAPGGSIENGSDASIAFTVSDPDRIDSSWRVRKIAGDGASYFPRDGVIENGLGDVSVAISDDVDNVDGFITFEVNAYDDDNFGVTSFSTRAVRLATFTTNGQLSDNAPVISDIAFNPTGPVAAPGTTGSFTFTISDPDTLDLEWEILIVSGDSGGTFSPRRGSTSTGAASIQVAYEDDADTPTASAVIMVRVTEDSGSNRQSVVRTFLLDKGPETDPDTGTGGGTTGDPMTFELSALYGNFDGDPDPTELVSGRTIFYNGNPANPRFFRNADLSGELVGISYVVDISHSSANPGAISEVVFDRDFQTPASSPGNSDSLTFVGYYPNAGARTGGQQTPATGYVARYRMTFSVEDFRVNSGDPLNLPTTGSSSYDVGITAVDNTQTTMILSQSVTVTVP